jgi:hypothetical protein
MNAINIFSPSRTSRHLLMTGLALALVVLLIPKHALAVDGPWMPVGSDDPRGYAVKGFISCLKEGDLKAAFLRVQTGVGNFKAFSEIVKAAPALQDIRSFELLRVTAGGGQASMEARTKDASGRSFPITFRLKQCRGGDEGWLISAINTDASSFPQRRPLVQ